MKHLGRILVVFLAAMVSLTAAEAKQLRIPLGSLIVEEVPFKIENISISNPSLVKVEIISLNGRQVRISGLKTGITDVQLLGGGMSQVYKVTISDDLREKFNSLKRDLDAVPEVDISMNNGKLVLKGELSSIANQELKNKVVKSYGSYILDLTTFRPTPEVMLGLQKNFEKAGFKVIRNAANAQPGEISITQVGEMLTITGSVYGPEDLKKINSILSSQPWLTVNSNNSAAVSNKVQAYVNVQVLPVMLQLDIIHIALTQEEARKLGIDFSKSIENGLVDFSAFYNLVKNRGESLAQNGGVALGTGIAGTLKVLGENKISRIRRSGFVTFKSNDPKEFRMLNGGEIVLSSTAGVGANTQLKEYEYGLILQGVGGLTGFDTVSVDLKQELSYPGPISKYVNDAKMELKKFETRASYVGKLGEPIAIAGLKEFTQTNTNKSSLPYLRNVPVLKWLISEEDTEFKDDEVITLICIRKMNPASKVDPVAAELNRMKLSEDKHLKDRNADQHKYDGKWYEFWKW